MGEMYYFPYRRRSVLRRNPAKKPRTSGFFYARRLSDDPIEVNPLRRVFLCPQPATCGFFYWSHNGFIHNDIIGSETREVREENSILLLLPVARFSG